MPDMKKRVLLCFFSSFLFLLFFISAASSYDGWLLSGDGAIVDGINFSVGVDASWTKTSVSSPIGGTILNTNECEKISSYYVCIEEVVFDLDNDRGRHDYDRDIDIPAVHILITKPAPSMTITRDFSTTSPMINEEVEITLTIKNGGDASAVSIVYEDEYPYYLNLRGAYVDENKVRWTGFLSADQETTFKYYIRPSRAVDESLKADLSYFFDGDAYYMNSSAVNLKTAGTVSLTTSLSPTSNGINQDFAYTVTVENKDEDSSVSIDSLTIYIPSNISYGSSSESLKKTEGTPYDKYVWSGTLEPDESWSTDIAFSGKYSGSYDVKSNMKASYHGTAQEEWSNNSFTVTIGSIEPSIGFMSGDTSIESNQESNVRISLENQDGRISFSDLRYNVKSDFFAGNTSTMDVLRSGAKEWVYFNEFKAPWVDLEQTYYINISGTYKIFSGQKFSFSKSQAFTISPVSFDKRLEITQEMPEEMARGEEATIKIFVKNAENYVLGQASVRDELTGLEMTGGTRNINLGTLESNQQVFVYEYSIRPDTNASTANIKTTVEYTYDDEIYREARRGYIVITGEAAQPVEEPQPAEDAGQPEQQTAEPPEPSHEDAPAVSAEEEKEDNFIVKIVKWFVGLLKSIF